MSACVSVVCYRVDWLIAREETSYGLWACHCVIRCSSKERYKQNLLPLYTSSKYTRSVRKVSDRIFLCEHLMDYNLARLHEPTLNLSAHA